MANANGHHVFVIVVWLILFERKNMKLGGREDLREVVGRAKNIIKIYCIKIFEK